MAIYLLENGNAASVGGATGTAFKTMLQVKMGPSIVGKIIEWGCSFNGYTAAPPGQVELLETSTPATMGVAHQASDISKIDGAALAGGDPTVDIFDCAGLSATGFAASAEGSYSFWRPLAGAQYISPTNQFIQQFALGREPVIQVGRYARIRMIFGTSVSAFCYVVIEV